MQQPTIVREHELPARMQQQRREQEAQVGMQEPTVVGEHELLARMQQQRREQEAQVGRQQLREQQPPAKEREELELVAMNASTTYKRM
jgi:N-dimethylarginine dimethylaminohydrolase